MDNPTCPGVYFEEVQSGVRPIEAVSTSTAAFIGGADSGPVKEATKIYCFTEFVSNFGTFRENDYLAHAVFQFFNNGGSQCYVVRVDAPGAVAASVKIRDRGKAAQDAVTISAATAGAAGNQLMVVISSDKAPDPNNQFNAAVFSDNQTAGGAPVQLEEFKGLGMDPNQPNYVETIVNKSSKFIRITVNQNYKHTEDRGYSESAAIDATKFSLTAKQRKFRININNDGLQVVDLTKGLEGKTAITLADVSIAVKAAIIALKPLHSTTPPEVYSKVEVSLTDNKLLIISGAAGPASSVLVDDAEVAEENAAAVLMLGKKRGVEASGSAVMRPQDTPANDYYMLGDDTPGGAVGEVVPGKDGTPDYLTALHCLDTVRDVSLIAIPGIGTPDVVNDGMNYCAGRPLQDCFFIADTGKNTDLSIKKPLDDYRAEITPNTFGAVYYPWIKMSNPDKETKSSKPIINVPPSGFVAGTYARIDAKRGVWKAPAGIEAALVGAVGLDKDLTDAQQGELNEDSPDFYRSICAIRQFPGAGLVVWGARTMCSQDKPDFKYIPVRRMAIFLRSSIYWGIQWAVFEPNDEDLWAALRLNIGSFMMNLFRQGAFKGTTSSQAFFVKCDKETTTQEDIDSGIVNVLVGFAPLKPAEFVVVKISQVLGQS